MPIRISKTRVALQNMPLNEAAEVSVASNTTTEIGGAASNNVNITGTTTITAFDSISAGVTRKGRFSGILTLTHNATTLILPGTANITTAANDRFEAFSLGSGNWLVTKYTKANGAPIHEEHWDFALSDETTAITTGTAKLSWYTPYAITLTSIPYASLTTASTSGLPTVDINEAGTTILGADKLSIDANELTSGTAATATTLADTALAAQALITFDIDVAGTGAKGLKVRLFGRRT